MTSTPATKNFAAWINLQPGAATKLIVVGEVQTNGGNIQPQLSRVEPQGIVASILLLNLEIVNTGGVGTSDINFRPVRYEEAATKGQFLTVEIHWEGQCVVSLPVSEAH